MLPDIFPDYLKFTSIRGECKAEGKGNVCAYKFQDCHKLNGTLITVRIPVTSSKVDIYEYVGK